MLEFIVEGVAKWIAGEASAPRWAYVTALFGWAAAVALAGWLVATVLGFSSAASGWMGLFSSVLGVALSLDMKRLQKQTKNKNNPGKR
jgi:hypothetical protein